MSDVRPVVKNLQQLAIRLIDYWQERGCVWSQPYDMPMGAGTFHPHTFLRGIGPEPWRSVYVQPCRRPVDGRYGESPYRFQHYYQLQVLLKPAPCDIVDVFLSSLESVGIRLKEHDIGLLEDDWKGPTLGAWGLGWEVRANAQEITQFTYFQQLGGMDVDVVCGEITYGLERLFMYATGTRNGLEIPYNDTFTYGDVFYQNEFEFSHFNFRQADTAELVRVFAKAEDEVQRLVEAKLVLPAYDYVLTASHAFNLLDARGAISAGERQRTIGRVRDAARLVAELYRSEREKAGFPMLARMATDGRLDIRGVLPGSDERPAAVSAPARESHRVDDLLIEYGVEEMPPHFQKTAMSEASSLVELKRTLLDELVPKGSAATDEATVYFVTAMEASRLRFDVTQRRLILEWLGLPAWSPRRAREIWGPAERIAFLDGKLTPVGEGFCRKQGLDPSQVASKDRDGSAFLYAQKIDEPQHVPSLVLKRFEDWLAALPCPLRMRWLPASESESFVRPVRWIVALFGQDIVGFSQAGDSSAKEPLKSRFGLHPGRSTWGQRIVSPERQVLGHAREYFPFLGQCGIEPSFQARRDSILAQARAALKRLEAVSVPPGVALRADDALLDKVTGLAETPYVYVGRFSDVHLRLPPGLVASVLRDHMNAFSVVAQDGALLPYFVGLANYTPVDPSGMVAAAEQVVEGRLADGTFYFETDLKTPLEDLGQKVDRQVFQDRLGTLGDKQWRLEALVALLCGELGLRELAAPASLAARLCKMDLQTGCVIEFPDEMQGVMGGCLLRARLQTHEAGLGLEIMGRWAASAEVSEAAEAIAGHYRPTAADDPLPSTTAGVLLSLADKWDTVVSLVLRGDRVKGSKDPFGLRRNTLAVLRLAGAFGDKGSLRFKPRTLMLAAQSIIASHLESNPTSLQPNQALGDLIDFVCGRIAAGWRERLSASAADAVARHVAASLKGTLSTDSARGSIAELTFAQSFELASALDQALGTTDAPLARALASYRRARNILDKSDTLLGGGSLAAQLDVSLLADPAERGLYDELVRLRRASLEHLEHQQFSELFAALAGLELPMARFFDGVMVHHEDAALRRNRLALLAEIRGLFDAFADFSVV